MTRTVAVRTSAPSGSPCSHQNDERDRAGGEGDVEQERGGPVGERLGPRGRRLGRGDEAHDPRQRGRVADGRRPGRAGCRRRPRCPATTESPGSLATARDSPVIIDSSTSALPSATTPSAGTRAPGPDEHEVADARAPTSGTVLGAVAGHPLGGVRQQVGERRERAARLGDRAHLQPVAEQHDRDEGGQLPPDLDLEEAERRRPSWSRRRRRWPAR